MQCNGSWHTATGIITQCWGKLVCTMDFHSARACTYSRRVSYHPYKAGTYGPTIKGVGGGKTYEYIITLLLPRSLSLPFVASRNCYDAKRWKICLLPWCTYCIPCTTCCSIYCSSEDWGVYVPWALSFLPGRLIPLSTLPHLLISHCTLTLYCSYCISY